MAQRTVAVRQLLSPETAILAAQGATAAPAKGATAVPAKGAAAWIKPLLWKPGFELPGSLDAADSLGRIGSLEVYLATTKREVKRAQKLRYKVFFREGDAIADAATLLSGRDKDAFDKICDHLIVVDHAAKSAVSRKPRIVGTYRLLRQKLRGCIVGFIRRTSSTLTPC